MESHIERDYLASRYIAMSSIFDRIPTRVDYSKIFYQTNENLLQPYDSIDFYEKDVLSVLSSGDHVLTARYLEAKKVDAFDKNRLTLYYFYLRIWSIYYNKQLYPPIYDGDHQKIRELLNKVKPRIAMEEIALEFFKRHLKDKTNFMNFFLTEASKSKGKNVYRTAEELINYTNPKLDFYNYNIFDKIENNNQYDIILMSNVLEWCQAEPQKLQIAAENLEKLLKQNGIVLCSRLIYKTPKVIEQEKEIFNHSFDYEEKGNAYVYRKR